jgi:hypothetical protein
MNTLKNYIIGFSAMLVMVLTISSVAFAHGDNTTSASGMGGNSMVNDMGMMQNMMQHMGMMKGMMGNMGMMMNNPMWSADMSDEDWAEMQKMHKIMWKDSELSKEEFEWLANKQDEFMGRGRMNNFKDVSEFNEWKKSDEGEHQSIMDSYFNFGGGRSMQQ